MPDLPASVNNRLVYEMLPEHSDGANAAFLLLQKSIDAPRVVVVAPLQRDRSFQLAARPVLTVAASERVELLVQRVGLIVDRLAIAVRRSASGDGEHGDREREQRACH